MVHDHLSLSFILRERHSERPLPGHSAGQRLFPGEVSPKAHTKGREGADAPWVLTMVSFALLKGALGANSAWGIKALYWMYRKVRADSTLFDKKII